MPSARPGQERVTEMLHAWMAGKSAALNEVFLKLVDLREIETVARDWRTAKLWLCREIKRGVAE